MNCAGGRTTTENRLGRAVGPAARCYFRLCRPDSFVIGLPILSRSAALLTLLLQDGTVDLELTSSVIALDPGLAFGTLQAANLERSNGEVWQLPLAVVAAGCESLLIILNGALKLESSYDYGTGAKLRQLYVRGVQRGCIAELLTSFLGHANPRQSYVAGLLFDLPDILSLAQTGSRDHPCYLKSATPDCLLASTLSANADLNPVTASVLLANGLLEIPGSATADSSPQLQSLASSSLWGAGDACSTRERCQFLAQGSRLGSWAALNALRLSPWEFMTRLRRHKSWE